MTRTWRRSLAAMITVPLAMGALSVPATAASLHVTFHAQPGSCIEGTSNGSFKLELKNSSGNVIDVIDPVTPDGVTHEFDDCFPLGKEIKPGRRLVATSGVQAPISFTIPNLTVVTDRVKDVVRGKAPANKQVKIRLYRCSLISDDDCVHKNTRTVNVNGAGTYSRDSSSYFNARGFDEAHVTYTNGAGHTYTLIQRFPWMLVSVDENLVFGDLNAGQASKFRLRTAPGGSVLSTRTASNDPDEGGFVVDFGQATSTGREVSAEFASDARIKIPSTSLVVDPVNIDGDQLIHVRCLPNRKMMVDLNPGVNTVVMADDHGRATLNLSEIVSEGFTLTVEQVNLTCLTSGGDGVSRRHAP